MKIDDPLDDLKKAAHEAGLDWSVVQDRSPILDEPTKFSVRKLHEPKDKSKLDRHSLITKTARGQVCLAAMEWAKKNVSGFEELNRMTPDATNYMLIRKTIVVVESFVNAAMSRCEVVQV